jgi:hypothetical protein
VVIVSGLARRGLVRAIAVQHVACPSEALLFLSFGEISVIKMLSISPVLPGTQGDYRRKRPRVKETDAKWRQAHQGFLLFQLTRGPK